MANAGPREAAVDILGTHFGVTGPGFIADLLRTSSYCRRPCKKTKFVVPRAIAPGARGYDLMISAVSRKSSCSVLCSVVSISLQASASKSLALDLSPTGNAPVVAAAENGAGGDVKRAAVAAPVTVVP